MICQATDLPFSVVFSYGDDILRMPNGKYEEFGSEVTVQ